MTLPTKYQHNFLPIKYHLASFRAYRDGVSGIAQLRDLLDESDGRLFEWKLTLLGTFTALRSSIDLFRKDKRSCLPDKIRVELEEEWKAIRKGGSEHAIFWDFLRKERDLIIHEYEWSAYEAWLSPDGLRHDLPSALLADMPEGAKPVLLLRSGPFKGRECLELLDESASWCESRIFSAIERAGYDPSELRSVVDFKKPSEFKGKSLLSE
ncbi:hypothetical protein E0K89_011275 [Aquicoccus sp. SCR17]|nr:hypothetical protein [Carideicomes alvinocaridis]